MNIDPALALVFHVERRFDIQHIELIHSWKEGTMDSLTATLSDLAPDRDSELIEGYQRYVAVLETILTPAQRDAYAALIRRTGTVRIFDEVTPDELGALTIEEQAIAGAITADETATMENRRVVALLNARGRHTVAPDLPQTNSASDTF